ncbi:MAG: CPBP family glutamic-type intramembrane protease [Actinomycetota bacterium]|nr:CPBP family glutamic-type intramembrane protease [Actinomycetota bacterium]
MSLTPPGWYPDPYAGPGAVRYWTGAAWTAQVAVPAALGPAPPRATPPHPTLPLPVAVGAILSVGVPLVFSRYVLRALADQKWPIAVYVALLAVVAYGPPLVFWRYASRRWGTGSPRADVGLTGRWADAGWGPLTWLACVGAQLLVGSIVLATKIPIQNNTDQIRDARDNPGYVIPMLIVAVIAAPIVEEIVFRGLVQRGLLSVMHPAVAVGVQAVLFGGAHFDPARGTGNIGLVMVLSGVGAVLGGSSYLLRRLAPNMIAHAIINSVAMAIVLSGWTPGNN